MKEYRKQLIYTMLDDSEDLAVKGKITIAEYNQIFWNLHELNKTGKTTTIIENVQKFFTGYGIKAKSNGIGWIISWT